MANLNIGGLNWLSYFWLFKLASMPPRRLDPRPGQVFGHKKAGQAWGTDRLIKFRGRETYSLFPAERVNNRAASLINHHAAITGASFAKVIGTFAKHEIV